MLSHILINQSEEIAKQQMCSDWLICEVNTSPNKLHKYVVFEPVIVIPIASLGVLTCVDFLKTISKRNVGQVLRRI